MAIFSLEVFQADHGDSLLLHYGEKDNPKFILIDGGPKEPTFVANTASRLNQLKTKFPNAEGQLTLQMAMVSHIDDDHIDGLLSMTNFMIERQESGQQVPYDIRTFWFNSFDDILQNDDQEIFKPLVDQVRTAGLGAPLPGLDVPDCYSAAIVSSVNQGRRLRDNIGKLGIPMNAWPGQPVSDAEPLVLRPDSGRLTIQWDEHLKLTILAPNEKRLRDLQKEWAETLRKDPSVEQMAELVSLKDRSVANLSSIVVLAECGGKSMLLTGDARWDDMKEGAKAAGLLGGGTMHVDLFKLPHHGSDRNVTKETFQQIIADSYVASGNGEHGNPELIKTIEEMLEEARQDNGFSFYITNDKGPKDFERKLAKFLQAKHDRNRDYPVKVRASDERSIIVDLLEKVDY